MGGECAGAVAGADRLSSKDIVPHRRGIAFHLLKAMLDDVTNRDDADEPALIDHRQMAEFSLRHSLHETRDGLTLRARRHFARH